jgi:hypothetical protein
MIAQTGDALRRKLVDAARSLPVIEHEAGILKHAQMLRDRRTADRHYGGQLIDRHRSATEPVKDSHPCTVGKGIETGLKVSIHLP